MSQYAKTADALESEATRDFVRVMEAMRHHHKLNDGVRYPLPSAVILRAQQQELPAEAVAEVEKFGVQTQAFKDDQESTITEKSEDYADDRNLVAFQNAMSVERATAKETASNNIDAYYDKMVEIGVANPDSRDAILSATSSVSEFFNGLLGDILGFVGELVETIVNIVNTVVETITGFFGPLTGVISSFFGGFFLAEAA